MPERFFFDFVDSFRFLVWMFSFFKAVGLDTCESLFERNVLTKTEKKFFLHCGVCGRGRMHCRPVPRLCFFSKESLLLSHNLCKMCPLSWLKTEKNSVNNVFFNVQRWLFHFCKCNIFAHNGGFALAPVENCKEWLWCDADKIGSWWDGDRERIKRGRHLDLIRFGKIGRSQHQAPLPHQMPVCPPTPRPTIKMTPHTIFPTSSWSWDLKPTHQAHYGFDERLIGAIYLALGHLYLSFTGDRVIYIYLAQKHCTSHKMCKPSSPWS